MKLSEWARRNGVHHQAAWSWAKNGQRLTVAEVVTSRSVVVIDDTEVRDDLVRDMVEVLTSFCARLYGRRSAERKAGAAMQATWAAT